MQQRLGTMYCLLTMRICLYCLYSVVLPACLQMPEELLYHPEVMELREAIKALQAEFVDTHKALDAAQQEVKCAATGSCLPVWWLLARSCSVQTAVCLKWTQHACMPTFMHEVLPGTACLQDPANRDRLSSTYSQLAYACWCCAMCRVLGCSSCLLVPVHAAGLCLDF